MEKFNEELTTAISDFAKESTKETVKTVETKKKEREKETIEDGVRRSLAWFFEDNSVISNAYGDNTVTLATLTLSFQTKYFWKLQALRWISSSFCVMVVTMWRKKPDRPSTLKDSYSIRWYLMIR